MYLVAVVLLFLYSVNKLNQAVLLLLRNPEMTRYFMTIPEASQLVLQAGAMGNGGEVFLLDMGGTS